MRGSSPPARFPSAAEKMCTSKVATKMPESTTRVLKAGGQASDTNWVLSPNSANENHRQGQPKIMHRIELPPALAGTHPRV